MTIWETIISFLSIIGIIVAVPSGLIGMTWGIYRWWKEKKKLDTRLAIHEYEINLNRVEHGKKPCTFAGYESFVMVVEETENKLRLDTIIAPYKNLERVMKLSMELINRERELKQIRARLKLKEYKRMKKELEDDTKELTKKLKHMKKQKQKNKKTLNKLAKNQPKNS